MPFYLLRFWALLCGLRSSSRVIAVQPGQHLPVIWREGKVVKVLDRGKRPKAGDELAVPIEGKIDIVRVLRSRQSTSNDALWWAVCWPLGWNLFPEAETRAAFRELDARLRDYVIASLMEGVSHHIPWKTWEQIKGETPQFDFISRETGLMVRRVNRERDLPEAVGSSEVPGDQRG
mgnify:CR=1 FL=1